MDLHTLLTRSFFYGIFIGIPIWFVWWFIRAFKNAIKIELKRLHKRNEPLFQKALASQAVQKVEVLRDNTDIGSTGTGVFGYENFKPFQIHMILHSPPHRWFVYIHVEGSEPVLTEITEQRALAAVNS
jgi:hypothetical protein